MNKEPFDIIIEQKLKKELLEIKVSKKLKENIKNHTIYKHKSLLEKFIDFMNKTVEIPVAAAAAVCLAVCLGVLSSFIITDGMKQDKTLIAYSDSKMISMDGSYVIVSNINVRGSEKIEN